MKKLTEQKCIPCSGNVPVLTSEESSKLLAQLQEWTIYYEHHLEKKYEFPDFQSALNFVNKVGRVAEIEGHHPNIFFTWGEVKISIWTHKINGLTEADFILAAKIDLID